MNAKLLPVGLLALATALYSAQEPVKVTVDPTKLSAWTIDPLLFGNFYEEHYGDILPGICEQYLVNPSFEPWYWESKDVAKKPRIVFNDVKAQAGVAYPWQALSREGDTQVSTSKDCYNTAESQLIDLKGVRGVAGVYQRLALPDFRVKSYKARFYAKREGDVAAEAQFLDNAVAGKVLSRQVVSNLSTEWKAFDLELTLPGQLGTRFLNRFGVCDFAVVASGTGKLWIDQASLYPADAIEGMFNPTTLKNIKDLGITAIRWPGGNFTSAYHWKKGIGPREKRPSVPNRVWAGLDTNEVGTDEWLRFCKLANLELFMGVGFGEITAEETADWVEYCNGAAHTPMGRLRAANGHPEPYGVKYWGIGNEVFGRWQIGQTDAATYAHGLVKTVAAIKAKDPSVKIVAAGMFTRSQPDPWNETVLKVAGQHFDYLDSHHYVHGPKPENAIKFGKEAVYSALLGSDRICSDHYTALRNQINASPETKQVKLAHYEWAVLPYPYSQKTNFATALCTAAHLNTFIRNGDFVRQGAFHNFSFADQAIKVHAEPINARSYILQLYRQLAGGRLAEMSSDTPTYSTPAMASFPALSNITEVDAIAVLAADHRLHVCLVNRSLKTDHKLKLQLTSQEFQRTATAQLYASDDPFEEHHWGAPKPAFQVTKMDFDQDSQVTIPRHSLLHVVFPPAK